MWVKMQKFLVPMFRSPNFPRLVVVQIVLAISLLSVVSGEIHQSAAASPEILLREIIHADTSEWISGEAVKRLRQNTDLKSRGLRAEERRLAEQERLAKQERRLAEQQSSHRGPPHRGEELQPEEASRGRPPAEGRGPKRTGFDLLEADPDQGGGVVLDLALAPPDPPHGGRVDQHEEDPEGREDGSSGGVPRALLKADVGPPPSTRMHDKEAFRRHFFKKFQVEFEVVPKDNEFVRHLKAGEERGATTTAHNRLLVDDSFENTLFANTDLVAAQRRLAWRRYWDRIVQREREYRRGGGPPAGGGGGARRSGGSSSLLRGLLQQSSTPLNVIAEGAVAPPRRLLDAYQPLFCDTHVECGASAAVVLVSAATGGTVTGSVAGGGVAQATGTAAGTNYYCMDCAKCKLRESAQDNCPECFPQPAKKGVCKPLRLCNRDKDHIGDNCPLGSSGCGKHEDCNLYLPSLLNAAGGGTPVSTGISVAWRGAEEYCMDCSQCALYQASNPSIDCFPCASTSLMPSASGVCADLVDCSTMGASITSACPQAAGCNSHLECLRL